MYDAYWAEIDKAWTDECREIVSYVNSKFADDAYVKAYFINSSSYAEVQANEGLKIAYAMVLWGFGTISEDKHLYNGLGAEWDLVNTFPDIKDFYNVTYAIYGGDIDAFYSKEYAVKKDTTAHEIADTAFLNILPPITLSARFMLITGDDEILIIEGRTDPDATYYFVKPDYETVVERVSGDLKEGSFRYEIKISDSSFRGMTKAKIVAEKGSMKNFAEVVILRGFEAKDEFTKYYNKTKSYIEIPKTPIADILGNLTEYANGKYGFRITATVEKVFMQDGDTVVKMVISDTGETVYVRDYYQQWSPADHVGSVCRVYCNLVGTYENTGCGEFIGWIVKR